MFDSGLGFCFVAMITNGEHFFFLFERCLLCYGNKDSHLFVCTLRLSQPFVNIIRHKYSIVRHCIYSRCGTGELRETQKK